MTQPTLEDIRARIAGPEPVLIVEAPAGYGKTEEAVAATQAAAATLDSGQYVLFLTHTNAARSAFNARIRSAPAVMRTIHSLATDIVDLFAGPLGLPRPLRPHEDNPSYEQIITFATQVLEQRPGVARGLAIRYPVILVDEYQDCTVEQASFINAIAQAAPTRLRIFGDDLQAIYEFAGNPVDFAALTTEHPTVALTTAWRWAGQPDMQAFLVEARAALVAGVPIDLSSRPNCVTLTTWEGEIPNPHPKGHAPACIAALQPLRNRDVVLLTLSNAHALGLRIKLPGFGSYHEGSDYSAAGKILQQVLAAEGDPPMLCGLLVQAMRDFGLGMTKVYIEQIAESCKSSGVNIGKKRKIETFAAVCEHLYADATVAAWLNCLRIVLSGDHGVPGWRPLRGDQLYLLARVRPNPGDDPVGLLLSAAHAMSSTARSPRQGFMTIHRSKGLQFAEVALPYCGASEFKDDLDSRRRLYVAISRAQHRLHLMVPKGDPTPLLRY